MSFISIFLAAAGASAFFAWIGGWGIRWLAPRLGLVDRPDGDRRRHGGAIPLAGGVAAWGAFVLLVVLLRWVAPALFFEFGYREWLGILFSPLPLLVVGLFDDKYRLSAGWLLAGAITSIVMAMAFGIRIEEVTKPGGGVYAFAPVMSLCITALWLLACIGSTKFADGVDGLVAGQTGIGAFLISALCLTPAYFQPHVGLVSALFGGAFMGVLAHNWPKARIFLGEFGSTFAGLGLGILASISGAKVAIALMAMGFFGADMVWVMARRLWRGRSPLQGDRTHLHFLLVAAGVPVWGVAMIVWGLGLGFGVAALRFQTQGKLVLIGALILLTWMLSYGAERVARQKGVSVV